MTDTKQNMRAHAWCFENGVTEKQIQSSWDNALCEGNFIVKNLAQHGYTWRKLPPHLLQQLIECY